MRRQFLAVGMTLVLVGCDGCTPDDDDDTDKVCEANATQTCSCPNGGSGTQTCKDDGSDWGACLPCPGTSSGTVTSGVATSGTATSGKSSSGTVTSGTVTSGTVTSGTVTSGTVTSGTVTSGTVTSGTVTSGTATSNDATSGTDTSGTATSNDVTSGSDTSGTATSTDVTSGTDTSGTATSTDVTSSTDTSGTATSNDVTSSTATSGTATSEDVVSGVVTSGTATSFTASSYVLPSSHQATSYMASSYPGTSYHSTSAFASSYTPTSGISPSSSGFNSSSGACGMKPEEGTCPNGTIDCNCGLECVNGLCLKSCTTPETQDVCKATQLCTSVDTDTNGCLTTVGKDKSCAWPKRCGADLECQYDFNNDGPIPGTMACHTPCNYGTANTGCNAPERCLPPWYGIVEHQVGNDGDVTCDPQNPYVCDYEHGFRCEQMGTQYLCARPVAACGTAIPNVQVYEQDGSLHSLTMEEICNPGPSENVPSSGGSIPVSGSLFCDPHDELMVPPIMTFCLPALANGYNSGVCIGICYVPADGTDPQQQSECGADAYCEQNAYCDWPLFAPQNANQWIQCTDDNSCPMGSGCCDVGSLGRICITKTGMCSTGTPPG